MVELDGAPADIDQLTALALTNFGNFTSMRVENKRVRGLSLHLDRLARDCRTLFDAELDLDRIRKLIRRAVGTATVVARVTIFDPSLELGHPGRQAEPRTLVSLRPAVSQPLPPMRVLAVPYRRDLPGVKHVGLFGQLWHRRIAQMRGYDDAVFLDEGSRISEGATWNIGFVDDRRIVWPKADTLAGVTMALISQQRTGTVDSLPIPLAEIGRMQAAFATNSAIGVRMVSAVDDTEWTTEHPMLAILRREYAGVEPEPL